MRGQVAAFSCTTATQCVCQALLQQNPVQYARRPTCGKNRDRFRVKKPLQPQTWHIKLFHSKILCSMLVDGSVGTIGIGSIWRNHFVCLVSRQISIPTFCNRHMQQRRQCCSNCSKNVLFSVRVSAAEEMPTSLVLLLLPSLDMRGKIPTYSRATAKRTECQTFCVSTTNIYSKGHVSISLVRWLFATAAWKMWIVSARGVLRRPEPVCDDLHSICGKNRQPVRVERFFCLVSRQILSYFFSQICAAKLLLFPARQPHNTYIKLFYSKILCSMLVGPLAEKSGSVPWEETIVFVNVAAIAAKCLVFRAWFQQRKRSRTVPCTATNFVCLVSQ